MQLGRLIYLFLPSSRERTKTLKQHNRTLEQRDAQFSPPSSPYPEVLRTPTRRCSPPPKRSLAPPVYSPVQQPIRGRHRRGRRRGGVGGCTHDTGRRSNWSWASHPNDAGTERYAGFSPARPRFTMMIPAAMNSHHPCVAMPNRFAEDFMVYWIYGVAHSEGVTVRHVPRGTSISAHTHIITPRQTPTKS